jgi:aminoglycoside phosphotransferase
VVRVNPVATYVAEHHERLGLERFGIARRPPCVLLTPRFKRSRHVIALVLAEERQGPALVGKLPRRATDAAGLAREAENLRAVRRALSDASVPTVLAFEDDRTHPLLLETGLEGVPLSPAALRRNRRGAAEAVAGWLERLALATASAPVDDAWYERLVREPLRSVAASTPALGRLVKLTLARSEPLLDAGLPLVFEHGDLCHPNLLLGPDGRLGVLDWERARPDGLPGHDLFFFLAYAADPWAWGLAERYAERVGLDPALLRPLLALSCARAIASGSGLPRHALLWREALEEG